MAFTADEVANINNASLENYIDKGTVWKQNVQNKPMLAAFNENAGRFSGGNENVSFAVKSGQGGGSLVGYSGDDVVSYYNPTGIKRARFPWKEHHIGIVVTHTELKTDAILNTGERMTFNMDHEHERQKLADLVRDGATASDRWSPVWQFRVLPGAVTTDVPVGFEPDFNGDGRADIVVGAPEANALQGGVYVYYAGASGPASATPGSSRPPTT